MKILTIRSTAFTPAPMYSESDNKVSKKALLVHFDAALEMVCEAL